MLFLIEYFPSFALAFLVMSCNFEKNSSPIVSKKWLVCAYILNGLFVVLFLALLFGVVGSYLDLTDAEAKNIRSLRGHYFSAVVIVSTLLTLKGKFIATNKGEIGKNT